MRLPIVTVAALAPFVVIHQATSQCLGFEDLVLVLN
jgi:hypothetical protein